MWLLAVVQIINLFISSPVNSFFKLLITIYFRLHLVLLSSLFTKKASFCSYWVCCPIQWGNFNLSDSPTNKVTINGYLLHISSFMHCFLYLKTQKMINKFTTAYRWIYSLNSASVSSIMIYQWVTQELWSIFFAAATDG